MIYDDTMSFGTAYFNGSYKNKKEKYIIVSHKLAMILQGLH